MSWILDVLLHLLEGLWATVGITAAGAVLAAICAFVAGFALLSRDIIVRGVARGYVEVFRGTSALVQLFWFFYALPSLLGIRLDPFLVGVLVLGLNVGAYGSEVVRGALQAVPRGQRDAATALGLGRRQVLRHVVLPQAFFSMLPPFGNLLIELLKGTALVSMINVVDLTRAAEVLQEGQYLDRTAEIFALLLAIYFVLSQLLGRAVRLLERRLARRMGLEEAR